MKLMPFATNYGLRTTDYGLRTTDQGLKSNDEKTKELKVFNRPDAPGSDRSGSVGCGYSPEDGRRRLPGAGTGRCAQPLAGDAGRQLDGAHGIKRGAGGGRNAAAYLVL